MNDNLPPRRSHLFTIRLWREAWGDGQAEWRGQVQHVLSGEVRYFRRWSVLIRYLLEMAGRPQTIQRQDNEGDAAGPDDGEAG